MELDEAAPTPTSQYTRTSDLIPPDGEDQDDEDHQGNASSDEEYLEGWGDDTSTHASAVYQFPILDDVDSQHPLARPFALAHPFDKSQCGPTLQLSGDDDVTLPRSFLRLAHNNSVASVTRIRMLVEQTNVYIAQHLASRPRAPGPSSASSTSPEATASTSSSSPPPADTSASTASPEGSPDASAFPDASTSPNAS